ncbi:MAG: UDP-N-acetylmuramoyl-L-alanine--D-glutamate ligase [Victivallales bacterium]|nr:UDP-N-acetylmuramoyl-L-alanine--D-glutamate ligase [Victivallales bacterium]
MKGKKVLILGAGVSGVAAARLAAKEGAKVTLLDTGHPSEASLKQLADDGIGYLLGEDALNWKGDCDEVIYSPGIPLGSPLDELATRTGARKSSELAFGSYFLEGPKKIAVTGTNGKTTTVEMLEHCLKGAGHDAIAAGNIGLPISELARQGLLPEFVVVEVSSFQLEHVDGFAPDAAVILNITPDHLVRHGTMEAYTDLKLSLFHASTTNCVINASLLQIKAVANALQNRPYTVFTTVPGADSDFGILDGWLVRRSENGETSRLVSIQELPFSGEHNMENALAALAVGAAAGVSPEELAPHLRSFHTGKHRLECVLEWNGVSFVDDSKATNVDALIKALDALAPQGRDIALIAGGVDKKCSLDECLPKLKEYVKSVYLIGECRGRLHESWGRVTKAQECGTMRDAVFGAAESLRENGGIVLLSPACASQDMFRDYAQRGEAFAEAAREYAKKHEDWNA